MEKARLTVNYHDLELEYLYDPEYIYYEEATEMITCVCQNTMFPRAIRKMQAILNACTKIRSNPRWRDDTILPRLFDTDKQINTDQYKIKVGNPSANSESRVFIEDVWVRAEEGWVLAEKRCHTCTEKKPFRLFPEENNSIDGRLGICSRCSSEDTVETYVI